MRTAPLENALEWLRSASAQFTRILIEDGFLADSKGHLLSESVDDIERDMLNNGVDTENLSVTDLGMFASYAKSMQLLTMHRAKGREFDAVAIIDLHDGRVPHFSAHSDEEVDEDRRLFYVAITRAKRLLMYVTDDEDDSARHVFCPRADCESSLDVRLTSCDRSRKQ